MYGAILLVGLAVFITGASVGGELGGLLAVVGFVGTPIAALTFRHFSPALVAKPEQKLAALETQTDKEEPASRWERRQRLVRHWGPATPEQTATVSCLVRQHQGALVRTRPDGTAEVLTGKKGDFVRYSVSTDGIAEVVEELPSDGSYRALRWIAAAGFLVFAFGWYGLSNLFESDWPAGVLAFAGFAVGALALAALGAENHEHGALLRTKRGERWTSLGYPRD